MNTVARTDRFDLCLPLTLAYEGGWSNHPNDPGKATMRGVTQVVYDDFRAMQGEPGQSVKRISEQELVAVYRWRYWDAVRAGSLPVGVDYATFDFAVNSGVRRAARILQELVGVTADGAIGPMTIGAVAAFCRARGIAVLSDALCDARIRFLRGLPTYGTFGKGWERRVLGAKAGSQVDDSGVADRALRMIQAEVVTVPAAPVITPKTYMAAA